MLRALHELRHRVPHNARRVAAQAAEHSVNDGGGQGRQRGGIHHSGSLHGRRRRAGGLAHGGVLYAQRLTNLHGVRLSRHDAVLKVRLR